MSNTPSKITIEEIMPFHDVDGVELLPHIRKLPRVLYSIFVEVLRQLYSNIENHPLGTPVKAWDADPDKTQIWIDTEHRWEDEHPEFRPAIYISIPGIEYSSLTGRSDAQCGSDMQNSEEFFTRSGTGTVVFTHIGGTCGEAVELADSTMDYLDAFGKVIRDDFCFVKFALSKRVPLQQMPKESKERYGSVVVCSFELQDKWTLKLEAPILKKLSLRAGQRAATNVIV